MLTLRLLHVVARIALRMRSPILAKRIIDGAGRLMPPFDTAAEARRAADALEGGGTCLSRALTVAARLRDSEVVIGVHPGMSSPLYAHAWVEFGGSPLRADDPGGREIARLG